MATKRPAYQWFPGDYRRDTAVQACPFMTRAIWREMLDFMHDGEPRGFLTAGGKRIGPEELARMIGGVRAGQVKAALEQLAERNVYSTTPEGIIYSRRMVRDERLIQLRAEGGRNAAQPNQKDTPLDPPLPPPSTTPLDPPPAFAFAFASKEGASAPTPEGVTFAAMPKKTKTKTGPKCHPDSRAFVQWFEEEFPKHRAGATYLVEWGRDMKAASAMLSKFSLERLKKLAVMLWGAAGDSEFRTRDTDRGILALRSSVTLLDGILCQHERQVS